MSATRAILAAVHAPNPDDVPDAELLRRFADGRDEAAFEALVRRHAGLVWRVCRRMLGHAQDAEDAFQATFLVLARNPRKPRQSGTAAGFLFGVARRVAQKARARAAARAARSPGSGPVPPPDPATEAALRELQVILDDEIGRLPEVYRLPFLLCVLEGKSRTAAAAQLGVNPGTLSARLARSRLRLRDRLAKRGVTFTTAVAVADLAAAATAAPPELVRSAIATGVSGRGGRTVAGLAGGFWVRPAGLYAVAGLLACVAVAVGLVAGEPSRSVAPPPPTAEAPTEEPRPVVDAGGDALPAGAVARLGSARWRHAGEAQSISFSPDGKTLALLSHNDGTITLFETTTGQVHHRFPNLRHGVQAPSTIAFSPDGTVLACRFHGGTVQLWSPQTKTLVRALTPSAQGPSAGSRDPICFSPDGKLFAASTEEAVVSVWEVATGRRVAAIRGHKHVNPPLAFSPDGKTLFLTASKPAVQLWDTQTGTFLRGFDPEQSGLSLAISPDGKMIATGSDARHDRIIVSDVATGKEIVRFEAKGMNGVLNLAFTPDGRSLISGSEDAKVRVWDIANKREPVVLDSRGWLGRSMALSADGKTVAMGSVYNVVRVWDLATGRERSDLTDGHDAPIRSVAYSPDGRLLVTGGQNQQIRVWDSATGRQVRLLKGHSASQVSFSPDGQLLAPAWESNNRARVWDVTRGEQVREFVHDGSVRLIAFNERDKTIVTASWQPEEGATSLQTWDVSAEKPLRKLGIADVDLSSPTVSRNGRWVAGGASKAAQLRLCDLDRVRERQIHLKEMTLVAAFSPDDRLLATGGTSGRVRLWEVATAKETVIFTEHQRPVTAVAFQLGGRVLATADGGTRWITPPPGRHSIRFWDVATGREITRLVGHESDINTVAFSPDGRRFVAGLEDGTALIWETPAPAKPPAPAGRKLSPKDLAALKADLAADDAAKAYAAVWALAASPDQAVPFLAEIIRPPEKIDGAKVRRRIAELGNEDFAVREAASEELAGLGEEIEPELRAARAGKPSPEQAVRLDRLLTSLPLSPSPGRRLELRGVWALELIGTPAARRVLTTLAAGAPDAKLTREAKAALGRR